MPQKFYKHKLLLDEGFHLRNRFPVLNGHFDLKHVAADYKQSGLSDQKVHKLAQKERRLIITYNTKDFEKLAQISINTGIIGVSPNLTLDQIDKKLTSILMKSTKKSLFGKLTQISGET